MEAVCARRGAWARDFCAGAVCGAALRRELGAIFALGTAVQQRGAKWRDFAWRRGAICIPNQPNSNLSLSRGAARFLRWVRRRGGFRAGREGVIFSRERGGAAAGWWRRNYPPRRLLFYFHFYFIETSNSNLPHSPKKHY